jgi:alcohol dehydrogenase
MKAVVFHAHGPLENIRIEDIPAPQPAPGECLVKVKAVSLNGFDPMILRGIPGLKTPMPMIPGADVAGEIVELGSEVDRARWRVGDRVAVIPNRKPSGMMGETLRGGACELMAISPEWLLPVPDKVTHVQAACLPTAYGAAIRMMYTRGQVQAGEKVLILGASGGVGTCCVQLAKLAGCHVVAVTSSSDKAEKLRTLGADHVIDTSRASYVEEVIKTYGKPRTYEGGGGVDVVVNYSGGESWAECFRTLRLRGRLLTCGATAGYDPKTDIRYIWSFEFTIMGSNGWTREDHTALLDMIADGRLSPAIHSELPLSRIQEGYRDLIDRRAFGKIVLIP